MGGEHRGARVGEDVRCARGARWRPAVDPPASLATLAETVMEPNPTLCRTVQDLADISLNPAETHPRFGRHRGQIVEPTQGWSKPSHFSSKSSHVTSSETRFVFWGGPLGSLFPSRESDRAKSTVPYRLRARSGRVTPAPPARRPTRPQSQRRAARSRARASLVTCSGTARGTWPSLQRTGHSRGAPASGADRPTGPCRPQRHVRSRQTP